MVFVIIELEKILLVILYAQDGFSLRHDELML